MCGYNPRRVWGCGLTGVTYFNAMTGENDGTPTITNEYSHTGVIGKNRCPYIFATLKYFPYVPNGILFW